MRLLGREGADARTSGMFYVALLQAVVLYGSETWFMSPHIRRNLVGFYHIVAYRLTGRQPWRGLYGAWVYSPLVEEIAEAGLQEVKT